MSEKSTGFDEQALLLALKHYLPAQAPLKDFIHHNTLHAFQELPFFEALQRASSVFGYKTSFSLTEYRQLYNEGRISAGILNRLLRERKGENAMQWLEELTLREYEPQEPVRIGRLRELWKSCRQVDLDSEVHPLLFRVLCSYLDQGISIWNFPVRAKTFREAIVEIDTQAYAGFLKSNRAKQLLRDESTTITALLALLVGDESLYGHYLYDQQFAHQGWSGLVAVIEDQPQTLMDRKQISLHDLVFFELLLEIDALDRKFGNRWKPLATGTSPKPGPLFEPVPLTPLAQALSLWQEAYEWTYYDQVLGGLLPALRKPPAAAPAPSFQAMFCIDDRECSLRRHLEKHDPACETYGTPGFFGVEFFFRPSSGKFYTKLCPAPMTPKYLILEQGNAPRQRRDLHFSKHAHSFHSGWLIAQTLGFWSAAKLALSIFRPSMSPAAASSFRHMDHLAALTIENDDPGNTENGLQIGFTIDEMAMRVENLLKSIGIVAVFAPIVYVVGHGASSINNPHYAAYDCGACSGRPGSVNARVLAHMANHPKVRELLALRGITIPEATIFIGGLHDTTRDEILFFDEEKLSEQHRAQHSLHKQTFIAALDDNAKERARRFESIPGNLPASKIHKRILQRSVALFEPRPELNHATNALCIVGRRALTKTLFLDRRAFLNSYDPSIDAAGDALFNILKAAAPVCGGINLEYFFSRTDRQKLGAGTKLPHNVMGLLGVANGSDGDLRPGLPGQMTEVHDPVRLLMIVEHRPETVLEVIRRTPDTYQWFINDWVKLVAADPLTQQLYIFREGRFYPYQPTANCAAAVTDLDAVFEQESDNLPVYSLQHI